MTRTASTSRNKRERMYGEISPKLYRKIIAVMPIPCVDVVLTARGKFLLVKRRNRPAKGKWWFLGGRVLKNETLRTAVARKVREETGIKKIKIKKLLAARETMFRTSAFGPSTHSVNSVFLVEAISPASVRPDEQSLELRWFSRADNRWPPYVKEMLRLAGFR